MSVGLPIVLIHGALQTVGTWDLVVPRMKGAGRQVIVATLTGLEGKHLNETVALDTHIRDVVDLLEQNDLSGVTLVGHSYAGMLSLVPPSTCGTGSHILCTSTRWFRSMANQPWTSCRSQRGIPFDAWPRTEVAGEYGRLSTCSTCGVSRKVRHASSFAAGSRTSASDVSRSPCRRPRTRLTRFIARTSQV